jgi:hypothetical protein
MQRLEVSGVVWPLKWPLGIKWLRKLEMGKLEEKVCQSQKIVFNLSYIKCRFVVISMYTSTMYNVQWYWHTQIFACSLPSHEEKQFAECSQNVTNASQQQILTVNMINERIIISQTRKNVLSLKHFQIIRWFIHSIGMCRIRRFLAVLRSFFYSSLLCIYIICWSQKYF